MEKDSPQPEMSNAESAEKFHFDWRNGTIGIVILVMMLAIFLGLIQQGSWWPIIGTVSCLAPLALLIGVSLIRRISRRFTD